MQNNLSYLLIANLNINEILYRNNGTKINHQITFLFNEKFINKLRKMRNNHGKPNLLLKRCQTDGFLSYCRWNFIEFLAEKEA